LKNQCEDCVRKLDDWIAKKINMVLSIGMFIGLKGRVVWHGNLWEA